MNEFVRSLSPEDRRKLTSALKNETAKNKAGEMGASSQDLSQRVIDGKYQWVKKAELLKEEEKRKQLTKNKRPVRALRDGENSLVHLIQKTLTRLEKKAEELERLACINTMEKLDYFNSTKTIQTRTNTLVDDLQEIENQIEDTKRQNPLFAEAEKLLLLLSQLKKKGDMDQFYQLQKQYASVLLNYQQQRKSLTPLIESARHQREGLQREYWRGLQGVWSLLEKELQKNLAALAEKVNAIASGNLKSDIQDEMREAYRQIDYLFERKETLGNCIPSTMNAETEEQKSWDDILPSMTAFLDELEFMIEVLKSIDSKIEPLKESKSTIPSQRMAFADKKQK